MAYSQVHPLKEEKLEEQAVEEPPVRVIIHNDDVTPMDFVLYILMTVFQLNNLHAVQVMYTAHYHGSAYVQTLPRPEAVRRVGMAQTSARLSGFPLNFSIERE